MHSTSAARGKWARDRLKYTNLREDSPHDILMHGISILHRRNKNESTPSDTNEANYEIH